MVSSRYVHDLDNGYVGVFMMWVISPPTGPACNIVVGTFPIDLLGEQGMFGGNTVLQRTRLNEKRIGILDGKRSCGKRGSKVAQLDQPITRRARLPTTTRPPRDRARGTFVRVSSMAMLSFLHTLIFRVISLHSGCWRIIIDSCTGPPHRPCQYPSRSRTTYTPYIDLENSASLVHRNVNLVRFGLLSFSGGDLSGGIRAI